jgi:hypothetical protein
MAVTAKSMKSKLVIIGSALSEPEKQHGCGYENV